MAVVAGRALTLAFALVAVLGLPGRSDAQLSVDELELRLYPENPAQRTGVFRVTNDTDAPVQAMLELQDWNRDEGGANRFLPFATTSGSCREHIKVFPLSVRIDAHKSLILSLVEETCDITLKELQARLAERGHLFSIGPLWRFFDRHEITWKKRPPMQASRPARIS